MGTRSAKATSTILCVLALVATAALGGCSSTGSAQSHGYSNRAQGLPARDDGIVDVVATTPIMTDIARNVAGDSARVTGLVPANADPHTYELSLRDVRNIGNSDLALTNGMLLEQQSVLKSIDNGVLPGVDVVPVAEEASTKGATVIPLVENLALDTIWLGVRAKGIGANRGGTKSSEVNFQVTGVDGPGNAAAYVTGTFGKPEIFFNSADGFHPNRGYQGDRMSLPVDAHTHMSWAFSEPGKYQVHFKAQLITGQGARPVDLAEQTVTVAVGVAPTAPRKLDKGHYDITVDLDAGRVSIDGDAGDFDANTTEVYVPAKTLQSIPPSADYRFLGNPGDETYLLPQAVLGKHVHGELDPHMWHSAKNAMALAKVIRDRLIRVDPKHATDYVKNTDRYLEQLSALDDDIKRTLHSIPEDRRKLVTAHDGYAYLAESYGLDVAGFVTPNPNVEPSSRDIVALTRTMENLHVPAVFLEPTMAGNSKDLKEIANRLGVQVCTIRSDTLDETAPTYVDLMRTNAETIHRCLAGT